MKSSDITGTDLFAGCGGSSSGAEKVDGVRIRLAMNHWKLAVESHNSNFPDAAHDCADISASNPRRYPSTTFLIGSPECDHHTPANGKKKPEVQFDMFKPSMNDPAAERSRATMWDIPRFAEIHKYEFIVVENVVEANKWILFEAWIKAMHLLGYLHKCCYLNAMHFLPCPQSRDRMFIVFWKKGNKAPDLNFTPLAHCPDCGKDVHSIQAFKRNQKSYKFKTGYNYCCPTHGKIVEPYYYAAFNCIDWTDLGEPLLGKRKRGKICDNTIRRCEIGLERYGNEPFTIKLENSKNPNVRSVFSSLMTQTGTDSAHLLTPSLTAFAPFIIENKGTSKARSTDSALSTLTGATYHGILTDDTFRAFVSYYNGRANNSSVTDATGVFTGNDRLGLVNYKKPTLEDCYYRSFKSHEVKKGMAFDDTYIILGNSKEKVQQLGNAVVPQVMKWLVGRCVDTLK